MFKIDNSEFIEDDYEEEIEETEVVIVDPEDDFLKNFTGDINKLISEYIIKFFVDKEMHYGGPIPVKMLLIEDYIRIVARHDIAASVDKAYFFLSKSGKYDGVFKNENFVEDDVGLVLKILDKMRVSGIPKCFRGGILLMYLEFCEGIEIS